LDLSIVIVDFHSAELSARAAAAFREEAGRAGLEAEVIVVENGSTCDEGRLLRSLPEIRLISPGANVGYAGGFVRGWQASRGKLLFLSNPDVEPARGFFPPLVGALASAGVGAVAPRLVWGEGGRFLLPPLEIPSLTTELARIAARHRGAPGERLRRAWQRLALPAWLATAPVDLPGLVGAAILTSRETVQAVGPLDERFPLYFEDTDWFLRLGRGGLRARLVPDSVARHAFGHSARKAPEEAQRRFLESEARFFERHWSGPARAIRRFAGRLLPPGGGERATGEPRLRWAPTRSRVLVELSPLVESSPSAGLFVDGDDFSLAPAELAALSAGRYFLRATDLDADRVVASASFEVGEGG
jgi:GT2 family glycosyltransferase